MGCCSFEIFWGFLIDLGCNRFETMTSYPLEIGMMELLIKKGYFNATTFLQGTNFVRMYRNFEGFALLIVHCLLAEWNYDPWFSLVYFLGSNSSHLYQDKTFTPTWNTFWWIVVLLLFLGNRSPVMSSGDVVSKITKQFTIVKWFQPIFFLLIYVKRLLATTKHFQTSPRDFTTLIFCWGSTSLAGLETRILRDWWCGSEAFDS